MKTIGQIRQERLLQLVRDSRLSYADINTRLGRNRRDATLTQLAKGAPSSTTKKPRQMGSTQARAIEAAFKLPTGWFDLDPALQPDRVLLDDDGYAIVMRPPLRVSTGVQETSPDYGSAAWPFKSLRLADFQRLSPSSLATLEQMIAAYLGSPQPPDWRTVALEIAAQLDRDTRSDSFTTFVRAVDVELARPRGATTPASALP